jgi:hypothetical protein
MNPEIESMISTVSYDTSVPSVFRSGPVTLVAEASETPAIEEPKPRRSIAQVTSDGFKATGAFLLYGTLKVALATLGLDDDDDDDDRDNVRTARGRADRNLNHWIDARDQWRRDE